MRASKSITLSLFSDKFRASIVLLYADSSFNLVYTLRNWMLFFISLLPQLSRLLGKILIGSPLLGAEFEELMSDLQKSAFMLSQHSLHLHSITAQLHLTSTSMT